MDFITENGYAKINLTLDVTGKKPDGYHTVKMIMQSLELCDNITLTKSDTKGIKLQTNLSFLPDDSNNLAVKAANEFFSYVGIDDYAVNISLEKHIPVAAGLAGGSTDAAAVLRALNKMYKTGLDMDELCKIGVKIGADVPYCIRGGSMLAEGIGEILSPLDPMPDCHVVLCKPPFSVVTAKVYARMNGGKLDIRPDTHGMIDALTKKDYQGICHRLYNTMENITGSDYEEIGQIEDVMLECGADGTVMSGSGPTVFALFSDIEKAKNAENILKKTYKETYLTKIRAQSNIL